MNLCDGLAWARRNRRLLVVVALLGSAACAVELGWGRTTDWRTASGVDRVVLPGAGPAAKALRMPPVAGRSVGVAVDVAAGSPARSERLVGGSVEGPVEGPAKGPVEGPTQRSAEDSQAEPGFEWLGHAGFWVRWGDLDLVLDPNLSSRCTMAPRRWSAADLVAEVARRPSVDAVLISHGHFDHLDLQTLRALPPIMRLVVPTGAGRYVAELGLPTQEVAPPRMLGSEPALRLGDLEVFVVPAAHHGNRLHPLASEQLAVGYVLRRGTTTVYFAGDTGDGPHVERIAAAFDLDWALLPIGAYLPRWPLGRVHLDPDGAVDVALRLGAETVVPMHFGTFRLSLDRPAWALPAFARAAERGGVRWQMPVPMGQSRSPEEASP